MNNLQKSSPKRREERRQENKRVIRKTPR